MNISDKIAARLRKFPLLSDEHIVEIMQRGSIGEDRKRCWIDLAEQDRPLVNGFKHIEMQKRYS